MNFISVEPDIWNEDVAVMRYKVFDDGVWAFLNVNVAPVDPTVLRL